MAEEDTITVRCPLCHNEHRYELRVCRTTIMGLTFFGGRPEAETKRHYDQAVLCPVTNERFVIPITLTDTPSTRIDEVTVDLSEDEDNADD
jgi:hypothetical protein